MNIPFFASHPSPIKYATIEIACKIVMVFCGLCALIHHGSDLVYINSANGVVFPSNYESSFFHLYPFRTNAWARSQSQDGPCSHMTSWWRHDSETFPRYWPFVRGIHWSAVDSLHNEQNNVELFYVRIYKWLTRQWGLYPDSTFMGPTWGPPGSCRPQTAPMLAP